jgi:hypothetical protein
MSLRTAALKCTNCGRTIAAGACCDELDCPSPTCDRCLTEVLLKSIRRDYVHRGASMTSEPGEPVASPTDQ